MTLFLQSPFLLQIPFLLLPFNSSPQRFLIFSPFPCYVPFLWSPCFWAPCRLAGCILKCISQSPACPESLIPAELSLPLWKMNEQFSSLSSGRSHTPKTAHATSMSVAWPSNDSQTVYCCLLVELQVHRERSL